MSSATEPQTYISRLRWLAPQPALTLPCVTLFLNGTTHFIPLFIHAPCWTVAAMFLTRSEYDRGVNTFSPEGRLFQVFCLTPSVCRADPPLLNDVGIDTGSRTAIFLFASSRPLPAPVSQLPLGDITLAVCVVRCYLATLHFFIPLLPIEALPTLLSLVLFRVITCVVSVQRNTKF